MGNWWKSWEKKPKLCWLISGIWLLLLSWLAFFSNLGSIGLIDKTEALFVEVGHQMSLTGDWITPYWNGEYFFDYPVWGYWLVALSFKLFGVSEWAARLPSALTAISLLPLVFYTFRYFSFNLANTAPTQGQLWLTAWIGMGIFALNPAWVAWGRVAVTDMLLSSAIAASLFAFFLGYAQPDKPKQQQAWYIVFPIFLAIAVLAKGPVGIILPGITIIPFLLYVGKLKEVWLESRPIRTFLIFLVITVPWYAAVTKATNWAFFDHFLGFSNLERFTSTIYRHAGPWYFYIPWAFILLLPWSVYLPLAITRLKFWKRDLWLAVPRSHHLGLLAVFWFMIMFLFFSAAQTKLAGYILPVLPAGLIMITLFWGEEIKENKQQNYNYWPFIISGIINGVILAVLAVASAFSPQLVAGDPSSPDFEQALRDSGLHLILMVICGSGGLAIFLLLLRRKYWRWIWSANLLAFLGFMAFVMPLLIPLFDAQKQQPFRQLSQLVREVIQPEEEIFLIGYPRYSLVYYSQHQVKFFDGVDGVLNYLKEPTKFQNNSSTVLILTPSKYINKFALSGQDYQLIKKKGTYQLIRVQKSMLLSNIK